jgi:phytoene desaturase
MGRVSVRRSAVVVGAGIGGIVAAGLLARDGYAVTVLEKHDAPGGRCGQLRRDGHRFDVGPTLLLMPDLVRDSYAALGENMDDHLELRRVDPAYRIRFGDGSGLALTADMAALRPALEAIEPGSFGGLLRYLAEGEQHYRLSVAHVVGRNFRRPWEYFNPRNLGLVLGGLHALRRHHAAAARCFRDARLRAAFTFQDMYLGLSPFAAPATYSLLQYTELAEGVWFPLGGMYRVTESLVAIAERLGARFRYGAPVARIEVDGDRATGVLLADGERVAADVVLANADLPYVYRHLLPDRAEADRLERRRYTCSALVFYWGVDRLYPALDTHNVFLAGDYRSSFDRIFGEALLPEEPSFYVHAPARVDPAAAPAGRDTLLVLVPTGHLRATPTDWTALRARARAAVLRRLAADGAPDLADHIRTEVAYGPRTWEGLYGLTKGAAFGLGHDIFQVGYLRPHNRHRRYRNLYFAGASTHPGGGLPMVMLSGRLAAERIRDEVGGPLRA